MIRRKKTILTLFLIVIILSITFISLKFGVFSAKAEDATNVSDRLDKIGENKPINILIIESIRQVEAQKAIKLLEEKRTILEAERLQKEKDRLEEEVLALENDPNAKFAYLTFDDGPSATVTPAILDILKEYNIKATFFVVGSMVDKYPHMLKRIWDEGHKIGNHSYSHDYKYLYRNSKNFMNDINRADKAL
ncbi:MAG: polysaccharide deacetylase family protein, partial [Tissierella sp.]|nr:polysaccharide deacetylase family protein [Tissierella sp.]